MDFGKMKNRQLLQLHSSLTCDVREKKSHMLNSQLNDELMLVEMELTNLTLQLYL